MLIEFGLLGPVGAWRGGEPVPLGGDREPGREHDVGGADRVRTEPRADRRPDETEPT